MAAAVRFSPFRPGQREPGRAGWRWWGLALASAALGVLLAVPLARSVLPRLDSTTSSAPTQLFTSTGGVFSRDRGQPASPLDLPGLRAAGQRVRLAAFRGHPLIVNFWASWCAPCRQEMPALEAVARKERGRIDFLGVDANDQRGSALAFLRKTGVTYPVAFDAHATAAARYGVYGLPTTYFLSPTGQVLGHQVGALTESRLLQLLARVFPAALS